MQPARRGPCAPPHPPMTFSHGVYCHISDFIHMLSGARGFAPACHRRGGADTRGNGANNRTPPEEGRLGPGASARPRQNRLICFVCKKSENKKGVCARWYGSNADVCFPSSCAFDAFFFFFFYRAALRAIVCSGEAS